VNDYWIAACYLTYDLPLATLNATDFQDFADYEGLQIIPTGPNPDTWDQPHHLSRSSSRCT